MPRLSDHAAIRLAPMDFASLLEAWRRAEPTPRQVGASSWLMFSRSTPARGIAIAQMPELTAQVAARSDGKRSSKRLPPTLPLLPREALRTF